MNPTRRELIGGLASSLMILGSGEAILGGLMFTKEQNPRKLPVLQLDNRQRLVNLPDLINSPLMRVGEGTDSGKVMVWVPPQFAFVTDLFENLSLSFGETILHWQWANIPGSGVQKWEPEKHTTILQATKQSLRIKLMNSNLLTIHETEEAEEDEDVEEEAPLEGLIACDAIIAPLDGHPGFAELFSVTNSNLKMIDVFHKKGFLVEHTDVWGKSLLVKNVSGEKFEEMWSSEQSRRHKLLKKLKEQAGL